MQELLSWLQQLTFTDWIAIVTALGSVVSAAMLLYMRKGFAITMPRIARLIPSDDSKTISIVVTNQASTPIGVTDIFIKKRVLGIPLRRINCKWEHPLEYPTSAPLYLRSSNAQRFWAMQNTKPVFTFTDQQSFTVSSAKVLSPPYMIYVKTTAGLCKAKPSKQQ